MSQANNISFIISCRLFNRWRQILFSGNRNSNPKTDHGHQAFQKETGKLFVQFCIYIMAFDNEIPV